MARLPRLAIAQQLHHVIHRAKRDVVVFGDDADRKDYLAALLAVSRDLKVEIHAYALLPGHLQLLLTPRVGVSLTSMMQRVGRRFVAGFNARHGQTGSPWSGRYRSCVLQASRHLIDAMRHVELAPVAEGLVSAAESWPASSAAHHLGQCHDPLIIDHPGFWGLGNTPFEREGRYRRELRDQASQALMGPRIDAATEKGWALGEQGFIDELSSQQARRLQPLARGRRPRSTAVDDQSDPI